MQEVTILDKNFEVMISRKQIENRVKEIASQLNAEYKNKNPVFIGVLNGAFLFMADLFRNIETPAKFLSSAFHRTAEPLPPAP